MKDICPNLHNKQVAQEYGELEDLFGPDTAHLLWSRNNGYSIDKAPNGADSILFGELLHITNGDRTRAIILKSKLYSDEFLKWFGDWTSEDKRFKNANIIWGHPGTGKTWMFEHGAKNIIDFDSEYKSKIGNLKEREQLKKKIGKSEYNKKLDELFDQAKQEALKSGKKLLVSDMHFLRNRSKDLDIVTNISDQEFIQRSHQRGEHDEADKMEWKNSINQAMKNIPESKILNTTGYISDLFAMSNVSKVVDKNGEPQVTYHTVSPRYNPNFKKFDTNIEGFKTAIYHTDSIDMSLSYNDDKADNYEEIKNYDINEYNRQIKEANEELFGALNDINKDDFLDERNYDWFLKKKEEFLYYIKNKELDNAEYILNSFIGLLKKNKEKSVLVNGPFGDYFETFYQSKLDDLEYSFHTLYEVQKNHNPYYIERKLQNNTFNYTKIDFINIKNPKVIDADGGYWNRIDIGEKENLTEEEKQYYINKYKEIYKKLYDIHDEHDIGLSYQFNDFEDIKYDVLNILKDAITNNRVLKLGVHIAGNEVTLIKDLGFNIDDITIKPSKNSKFVSTRDLEKKYLLQSDDDARKNLKRIHRLQSLIQADYLNYTKVNKELRREKTLLGLKFKRNYDGSLQFIFGQHIGSFTRYGLTDEYANRIFKQSLFYFLNDVAQDFTDISGDGTYDGVIINNVIDYGSEVENPEPHTVYECVDNSQVKSIFNNGQFANPDDMYASPQGGLNMGASTRLSKIPSKGDMSTLQKYLKSHRGKVSSTALKLVMAAVNRYFNDNDTGITYEIVDTLPGGEAAHYDRANKVIRINKNARFRNESKSLTPEVQTIVHEMLHAVTVHAIETNSRVREQFQHLLDVTRNKLGDKANYYGLTDVYEFVAELSNAQFVQDLKSIQLTRKQTLLDRIKGVIKKVYRQIFTSYKDFVGSDNVYSAAVEDLFAVMSNNVRKDEDAVDVNRKSVYRSISASQDKIDQIHKEITNLYQQLYKNYKKQFNKGANRQKREDSLWATIRDLQAKDKKEASSIAIQQAFNQIGVYTLDPVSGVIPARRDTVLGYLQEQSQNGFDNISAEQIFDMKSNIIDFYNDLCKYLFDDKNSLDVQDQLNVEKLSSTVHEINRLWREASKVVADKIVDENVDKYINTTTEEANEIKEVAKDWLHNNDMWGDEGKFTKFFNYSRNDSPIIRQAFQMIQDADQETRRQSIAVQQRIVKAYNKATSIVDKAKLGNWQTEFMERDRDGNFTGLFRSAVNRGQFKKDMEEFVQQLNQKYDKIHGYHYITDQVTKETLRSDTMSSIENEVWVNGQPPVYVQYQLELEKWICDHAHRRYSLIYYQERLSQPYDMSTRTGHGLSPRTLSRQKYIQDQLNYILQKCSDRKTGLAYPERLNQEDYNKLQMWRDALQDLGNPFDMYGNRKSGEELQTALEIQAWNNWLQERTLYDVNYDAFDEEYQNIVDDIKAGKKTYNDLCRFVEANSEYGLNPEFLDYVFKGNQSQKDYVTRMFQSSIKKLIKTKDGYVKDFSDVIFNYNPDGSVSIPDMWGYQRLGDIKNNQKAASSGISKEEFERNFSVSPIPYTDSSGMHLAKDGTKFNPKNNPNNLISMSWFEYILKQYTDAVMDGRMDRFVSVDGLVGIDFSTFNGDRKKIEKWIAENILMYEKTWEDKYGNIKSEYVPLTIFNQLVPVEPGFGPSYKPTSRFIPKGRFTTKRGSVYKGIFDMQFSEDDRSGIQPDFAQYGDQEFVDMIKKGDAKAEYYKLLIDTMEQQWDKLGLDPSYNRYKLPQIEGTSLMKRSRAARHPKKYLKNAVSNAVSATSDDMQMRSGDDYVMRNGKWVLKTAPTRFINEMDDPSMISSDLAFTVGQFVQMTNNYLNKQKLQAKVETLAYSLDAENRDVNHQHTGVRQFERYEKMLKQLFYEQSETGEDLGEKPGKAEIAAAKAARVARSGTAYLMLAYNIPSMFTGVFDSFTQMPAAAARNDQFGFKQLFYSYLVTFPKLFQAIANIGNPIANCKAVAMMQKDGLVKTSDETFKNAYHSRLRRALAQSATGGYTMGDYMMNMLSQRCTYEAKKYYPGNNLVKEGFYTKAEFNRLMSNSGLTQKEINKDWRDNIGESLWDAYYFDNGIAKLKDKYKDVNLYDSKLSATIQQNMALLNGNAPKNDQSSVSNTILHKFFFLMRNFFIRRAEHWFAGYKPDNVVRKFEDSTEEIYRGSSTLRRQRRKRLSLTQEQKSRRQMYDYSTGEANPAVLVNLLRGAQSQLAIFNQMMLHKQERLTDPRKVNPNEAKALREFITWGLCLALLSVGWMMFHRHVEDETKDLKPDNYEGSLPSIHNFIQQKVYLKLLDQVMFRVIDSQFQLWNPWQFVDMVKSATTVTSAVEKMGTIPSVGLDLIGASGHEFDEIIKSDSKYKYFPRWQRALWSATPLNNIQTWSSWRGNDKVGRWYFDNTVTGTMFKSGGYEWKDKVEDEDSERMDDARMDEQRMDEQRMDDTRMD